MKRFVKDLTDEELLYFLEAYSNKKCEYCPYEECCPKKIVLSPNGPVYPPCDDWESKIINQQMLENYRGNVESVDLDTGEEEYL